MANKVKIEVNYEAVGALLKSAEVQKMLEGHASNMANKSGGEYAVYVAPTRAVASVRASAKDNKLLKAMK